MTLHRIFSAKAAVLCAALVAACEAPAPTVSNDTAPESTAPVAGREARQIVVEDGQSISRIAVRYRVPKATIIAANRLEPPYKIKTGQRLVIPGSSGPAPVPASEAQQIVVEEGQSVSRIADKYRVPKAAIIAANGLEPPYKVKIGQSLVIPGPKEAAAPVVVASRASEVIPLDEPAPYAPTGSAPLEPSSAQPQAKARPVPMGAAVSAGETPPPAPIAAAPVPPMPVAAAPAQPATPFAAEPVLPLAPVAVAPAPTLAVAAAPADASCPPGTTGAWSTDITKQPVYVCR